MAYTKSRPYSWLEARRLKFLPSQSVDGVQEDKLESKDEEENKFFPIPNNKQLVKTKKQTESFIKDFDIPSMFETFDPSNSSKIITSEDLIKATEFRNSPLARFGPTVLGQLNPVFGILGRIGTFLIDRKIENVLNLRGDEDLLKQWKKGERKEVIESLTEKARVAEEAVKPVDVPVDIDAGQFEGGDTGVGATAISPQEAAAVAVAGGQNIDTSGQGTTPQPTTPTPEAPDIPDIEVPDTDQGAADVAASEAGISIFDFKKGGQVRQPMAVGSLVKAGSKVLTKLQKQPVKKQMETLTSTPKKLIAKDPAVVEKQLEDLEIPAIIPEASQKTQLGTTTIPTYKKVEQIFKEDNIKGNTLDFGAGRGLGAKEIKADTFEPFPRENFKPNYTSSSDIPTESYNKITSLNVLNVMPKEERAKAVSEISRILKPEGSAIISTRGADVLVAKTGIKGAEPMSIILPDGRFQKGFKPKELTKEIKSILGNSFTVTEISGVGATAVKITKKRKPKTKEKSFEVKQDLRDGGRVRSR